MKHNRTWKVLTLVALSLVLLLSLVSCGDLEVEKFTPVRSSVKTTYLEGEAVDFSGIKVQIQYNDSDLNAELTIADGLKLEYDENITATAGNKQVKITYECPHTGTKQEAILPILVEVDPDAVKHDSYVLDTTDMKTSYVLGETVDFTGIKIIEKFTNGGADVVMTDLSLIAYDYDAATITATVGSKQIAVTYNGEAVGNITITVNPPEKNAIEKIVILGDYATRFEKGKNILFTGMSLKVTYKEGEVVTVLLDKLTFTGADQNTVGRQTVTVSFLDEINNETASTTFSIEIYEKKTVVQLETPDEITDFKTSYENAGKKEYGELGFESQYENKATYLIGDDNEFSFYPKFTVMDGTVPALLKNGFYSKVTVSVKTEDGYAALEAKVEDPTKPSIVSYYDGETLLATVNTYYGRYQFTEAAKDLEVKITVRPDDAHYTVPTAINPAVLEAKVIDGYNVTAAWQFSVLDNTQTQWNSLKTEWGILGLSPAAVILHKDIKITAADIPAEFLLTLDRDIVYTNNTTGEEKTIVEGTKYVRDWINIYVRSGDADFALEGNFFTLDLSEFPLVPSPVVFGDEGYGSDFSNTGLIYVQYDAVEWNEAPAKMANIVFENFSFRGNAGIDKWVDSEKNLVSAGGLIFAKACDYTDVTVQNANITSCFISFFSDRDGYLTLDTVKVYDSYQNALYIWGNHKCDVKDSYFVRAGGPMVIAQSVYWNNNTVIRPANLNVTDTVIESGLTGEEIWFTAVNATPLVSQKIKPLMGGLEQAGIGQFMTADGKMNIVVTMISDTGSGFSDLQAVVGNGAMTGTVLVNGGGINRQFDDPLWGQILSHPAFGLGAAFLTVGTGADAVVLYHNGEALCVAATGEVFNPLGDLTHAAMYQKFASADSFVLSQGGMTVVFARAEQ